MKTSAVAKEGQIGIQWQTRHHLLFDDRPEDTRARFESPGGEVRWIDLRWSHWYTLEGRVLYALHPSQTVAMRWAYGDWELRVWPIPARASERPADLVIALTSRSRANTRWAGVAQDGPAIQLPDAESAKLPRRLAVPSDWIATILHSMRSSNEHLLRYIPWHDDSSFAPIRSWSADEFHHASFLAAPANQRRELLKRLWTSMTGQLPEADPSATMAEMIAELRRCGHDLWSWDYDGACDTWGYDYMRQVETDAAERPELSLCYSAVPPVRLALRFGRVGVQPEPPLEDFEALFAQDDEELG